LRRARADYPGKKRGDPSGILLGQTLHRFSPVTIYFSMGGCYSSAGSILSGAFGRYYITEEYYLLLNKWCYRVLEDD